ncbi:MAG: polysaccharide pyruvyl transferase family protein [Paraglaciecola sp.]|uniref:polysaccharide pyruvyl transferase family protein n=1 Tax=Paraglaciecola sp. TaxID=1920173 RepID=UPI00329784BB
MKVAIWGSYEHGNFGDDLMAIIFAAHLKKLGCEPIVFRLDSEIAKRYSVETTNDINKLLENSSLVLIGGGGMLVVDPSVRRYFSRVAWNFESDFKQLLKALKSHNLKVIPLSIGGNGENKLDVTLPKYRRAVFSRYCDRATLRLSGDIPLANKLDIEFECIPDILLGTAKLFNGIARPPKTNLKRIGINIVGATTEKLAIMLEEYCSNNEDVEVVFINTHLDGYGHNYERVKSELSCERITNFCHNDDFSRTFSLLASLDLLISSKLHLGVTAMTFGTPFISYQGKKKTNSFLKNVSIAKTVYFNKEEDEIVAKLKSEEFFNFNSMYDAEKFENYTVEALQHLSYLEKLVEAKK